MTMTFNQIEAEVLALPEKSRAKLLERLLLSFEEKLQTDEEVARAWTEEAERRDQEMNSSGELGVPAAEVFKRLRSSLK